MTTPDPTKRSPCSVYNTPIDSQADKFSQEFIRELQQQRNSGYGFVPLIGAGLSAPSGVPIITELRLYLQRCVGLALGADILDPDERRRRWNPRKDRWPPLSDPRRPQDIDWFLKVFEEWQMRKRSTPKDPEISVFQEALGALAEWRTALQFLSRLDTEVKGPDKRDVLYLNSPDQDVVDAFFLHVTQGKRPTLGHRMIAHLATELRIHTLLTINFDELLEQAFEEIGRTLCTYDVHLDSGLPPLSTLRKTPSLIKMHGGRYSLRGDYSLDTLPTEEDRSNFVSYLTGYIPADIGRNPNYGAKSGSFQNHLLVVGCSASDRRITALIKEAWDRIPSPFCVYWICYRPDDVEAVEALVQDAFGASTSTPRCYVLRHTDTGLLFLEAFQILAEGLPESGIVFPSLSRLALPPIPSSVNEELRKPMRRMESVPATKSPESVESKVAPDQEYYITESDLLYRHVERTRITDSLRNRLAAIQDRNFPGHRLIIATTYPFEDRSLIGGNVLRPVYGITTVAAQVFGELQALGQDCLWLDMNDISGTNDLFEQLLDAVCYRAGVEDWMPVYLEQDLRSRIEEINRITYATGRNWVIFINARETPGANFDSSKDRIARIDDVARPNGWLDNRLKEIDNRINESVLDHSEVDDIHSDLKEEGAFAESFISLIRELSGRDCPNVSVVVLCRPQANANDGVLAALEEQGEPPNSGFAKATWIELRISCVPFDIANGLNDVLERFATDSEKRMFLHAMVLMQRTRYLATFFSALFQDENGDRMKFEKIERWIEELENFNAVRRKAGGFIWFHAAIRDRLRILMETPPSQTLLFFSLSQESQAILTTWKPCDHTASIHQGLIEWYYSVFLACHSPGAIFEAVHHACEAALSYVIRFGQKPDEGAVKACASLRRAETLLRQSASTIRTRGFSRGSCRRLKALLAKLVEVELQVTSSMKRSGLGNAIISLKKRCVIIMRGVAREVSEHATAYARHRQLCEIIVCGKISETIVHDAIHALKDARIEVVVGSPRLNLLQCLERWAVGFKVGDKRSRSTKSMRQPLWIRWWKWTALLGKESRSYWQAEKALLRALGAIVDRPDTVIKELLRITKDGRTPSSNVARFRAFLGEVVKELGRSNPKALRVQCNAPQDLRREVVLVLEQYMQLMLLIEHLHERRHKSPASSIYRETALLCYEHALAIIREIEFHDDANMETPSHIAASLRVRLLTHRSILEARILDGRVGAMRLLNEAESTLHLVDRSRRSVSWAIINLHRAEIAVEAARTARPNSKDDSSNFGLYVKRLRDLIDEPNVDSILLGLSKICKDSIEWRGVRAILKEATISLNEAESVLMARRKNVWWATWYFQRRLKVVEFELWATVGERQGQPIPYVGLEAATRRTKTLPDELLENACRMVRLDAYRLATVIETYAYCLWALHIRLLGDRYTERLPRRQREMRDKLKTATEHLNRVIEKRMRDLDETNLHSGVLEYINFVLGIAEKIVLKTNNPPH